MAKTKLKAITAHVSKWIHDAFVRCAKRYDGVEACCSHLDCPCRTHAMATPSEPFGVAPMAVRICFSKFRAQ
jgi:hypothetical protein